MFTADHPQTSQFAPRQHEETEESRRRMGSRHGLEVRWMSRKPLEHQRHSVFLQQRSIEQVQRRPFSFGKTVLSCTGLKIWLERRPQNGQEKKLVGLRWKLLFGAWMLLAATTWTSSERRCPVFCLGACNCTPAMLKDGLWLVAAALG